jgi:hypothetical protein
MVGNEEMRKEAKKERQRIVSKTMIGMLERRV